jgi:CRP-like cAMP-binding protein
MTDVWTLLAVALIGLFTTSAVMVGATLGMFVPLSRQLLASILAFAAGILISSLGIALAFEGASVLHGKGFSALGSWLFIAGGFATGAVVYFVATRFLDKRGAAVRSATRFREYVLDRMRGDVALLAKCDILRHLPPEAIDDLLDHVDRVHLGTDEVLFRAGDPGDALYIVAKGKVLVLQPPPGEGAPSDEEPIAELGEGAVFGEMALLSGAPRTATIQADAETDLLRLEKADFDRMVAADGQLAIGVQRLSHERAISNLATGGTDPGRWARVAKANVETLSRRDTEKMLQQVGHGAGLAIMLGDLLDTVPGCLVIGASFTNLSTLSFTVMMGIFVGGIPESAASAALLRKAGYSPGRIYRLWTVTLIAGVISAVIGKAFIGASDSLPGIFAEAMAGGSLLALVSHAMIPEALHQGGSQVVLPTVAGFLVALYLILMQTLV